MARKAVKSLKIPAQDIKSNTIFVIVTAGYPTMAFWNRKEAERVMALTLQNIPKYITVKPQLHECKLY